MKFVTPNPFAGDLYQNDRYLADSLGDGKHDININSASIVSASITDATITSANITSMSLGYSQRLSAATIYGASGNFAFASLTSAGITTANITSATIGSATITGLQGTTGTIATFGSTSATIQTLQNPTYANITSANITTALIASATITSATITGAKIGTLQGLIKGEAGVIGAVASGATTTYVRGDLSMQTFNVINGDGTAGRVIRHSYLYILNGTTASTLNCTLTGLWNGDDIAATDNIAKGGTTGNFNLNAGGTQLTILNAGIQGDAVACLVGSLVANDTGVATIINPGVSASGITINAYNAATGAGLDLTTAVDPGGLYVKLSYLTSS